MSEGGGLPDLSGILSRVAENPQAMSMLGSLLGGMSAKPSAPPEDTPKEASAEKEPEEKQVFLPLSPPHRGGKQEERRRLLLAIKPFLSPERQRALETLLPVLEALALFSPRKEPPCT